MHKLYEYICDELKGLEKKAEKGNMSMQEIQYADTLAHLKKNLLKSDEMMEDGFGEYSMAYYPMTSYAEDAGGRGNYYSGTGMRSYARGRGGNVRRDSMGRYSRAGDDVKERLMDIMEDAPDHMKSDIQRLINKI